MPSVGSGVTETSQVRSGIRKDMAACIYYGCICMGHKTFKILNACSVIIGIFKYIHTYICKYKHIFNSGSGRKRHSFIVSSPTLVSLGLFSTEPSFLKLLFGPPCAPMQ